MHLEKVMKNLNRLAIFGLLLAGVVQAQAMVWTWTTTVMSGLEEVPPNASPGTGLVTGTLDDVTGAVLVVTGFYSGLLAPTTASHIHGMAPPGTNAGVILPLTHTSGTSGTLSGAGVLTGAQVAGMIAGNTYVNVHTAQFPGGEIRGQITATPVPEPAAYLAVLLGAGALILKRRSH